jgi:4-hydroxy-tetrahydrodipicolinate reductase
MPEILTLQPMKIALLGHGKMGKEIEKMAYERHHDIVLIIDTYHDWASLGDKLGEADMAIDFSIPECAANNIRRCFKARIPVVTGTTGWHHELDEIRSACITGGHALFWAPNFSIGVNLFFELNRFLASLMSTWPDYELSLEETHHTQKTDAPSGTAIVLANDIIQRLPRKDRWVPESPENDSEFSLKSIRIEDVTGKHAIIYESDEDTIEIVHTAKNRKGFALGAILAAEWLQGKTGFFDMNDFLTAVKNNQEQQEIP